MMKKLAILFALCLVVMLALASTTSAMQAPYTHGDFATNSKGCGDCHITHSADVAKLLFGGAQSTQTAFCLSCHGRLSPFDVFTGIVLKQSFEVPAASNLAARFPWGAADATTSNMSLAGGFSTSGDFHLAGETFDVSKDATSVHNVRGIQVAIGDIAGVTTYEYVYGKTIPGGTGTLDFECGSCHDPHAGGMYVNRSATLNPRLLKKNILGRTGMAVEFDIDQAENLPTFYAKGINNWCGSCHDIFDTAALNPNTALEADARTGYYKIGSRTKYMHVFGVDVDTALYGHATSPYSIKYLALSNNASNSPKEITCMTCHRAHGSSAAAVTTWGRYDTYVGYSGGTTATGQGSALLRLPERDVCFDCHGAALYNHSVTHSP